MARVWVPLVPERAYQMIASVGRADRVPDTAVAVRAYVNGRLMAWALLPDEQFGHAHSTPRAPSGARSEGPENRSCWSGCISMPRVSTLGPGAIGWRSPQTEPSSLCGSSGASRMRSSTWPTGSRRVTSIPSRWSRPACIGSRSRNSGGTRLLGAPRQCPARQERARTQERYVRLPVDPAAPYRWLAARQLSAHRGDHRHPYSAASRRRAVRDGGGAGDVRRYEVTAR